MDYGNQTDDQIKKQLDVQIEWVGIYQRSLEARENIVADLEAELESRKSVQPQEVHLIDRDLIGLRFLLTRARLADNSWHAEQLIRKGKVRIGGFFIEPDTGTHVRKSRVEGQVIEVEGKQAVVYFDQQEPVVKFSAFTAGV